MKKNTDTMRLDRTTKGPAMKQASELERAISLRSKGIDRMENRKVDIMNEAKQRCADIDKEIAKKRILLDALKRGALKP